jgi:predicted ATP-binding protein involved in virulence
MRISQISVKNLFGVFDHTIPIKMNDRITIIHGPNGFGKTAILRLIDGLFNTRYSELRAIPFTEFTILFDDGGTLKVLKTTVHKQEETAANQYSKIAVSYESTDIIEDSFILGGSLNASQLAIPIHAIEDVISELDEIGPETWLDLRTGESINLEEVLVRFSHLLPMKSEKGKSEPKWFRALKDAIDVRFIQTQRLLAMSSFERTSRYSHSPSMTAVVAEYSVELAKAIQSKLGEYGTLSQSLDRTFPARLVKEEVPAEVTLETLRSQLSELENKRNRLASAGLLDKEEDADFQVPQIVDERTKGVLSVYVKDVQEKLSIFDEMAAKIDLFKKIITERFKYKQMSISKASGISFTTYDGFPLSPTSLSSGEQHELVMLYEFLFKVIPNSLILIDEPEISLHIAWQEQFLRDLQEITKLASFDVLIATHSPQLIYDRWDLTVELKGPDENGINHQRKVEPTGALTSTTPTN